MHAIGFANLSNPISDKPILCIVDNSPRRHRVAGRLTQNDLSRGNNRRQDLIVRSMNLSSSPLGLSVLRKLRSKESREKPLIQPSLLQCACALRRKQTPAGYWKLRNHARRLTQLCPSRPGLRIEICVKCFIGRSPTQLVLCHKSFEDCKLFPDIFLVVVR